MWDGTAATAADCKSALFDPVVGSSPTPTTNLVKVDCLYNSDTSYPAVDSLLDQNYPTLTASSSVWLERLVWVQKVGGSNPLSQTNLSECSSVGRATHF